MIPVSASGSAINAYASTELAEPTSPPAHTPSTAPAATGDPLARFGAMHGLHAGVQQIAYLSPNGAGGTKAPPTPAVYDVAKTDQKEIDKLKASRDDATRRLGHTIENAKASYGDLLAKGAKIVVTTTAGNGGQPVMTLMGPGFDASQPARVQTHYHGDNATVADPIGSKAGTNSRIRDVVAHDPQTVFVLPEAKNAPAGVDSPENGDRNDYRASWKNVQDQARTTDDALQAAGITKLGKQIVSFHSGGGKVVQQLMALDASGARLRANSLELHDSLYGDKDHDWRKGPDPVGWEKAVADWGRKANGKAVERVIYFHGSNLIERHQVIAKAFGAKFTKVEMSAQKPLDDTVNPVYRDAAGHTVTRTVRWKDAKGSHVVKTDVHVFNKDPHYRTTGQFLGATPGP